MEAVLDSRRPQQGLALVLVLIFTVLLYVLTAELVTTARLARLTGENDALLARMRTHMRYTLTQVEENLRDDLQAAAAEGGEPGGLAGMAGGAAGGGAEGLPGGTGGPPGGEGGEEEDSTADTDSSQDVWFEPTAYADDDLTTYVWIEDENRKFNLLSLISPDPDFARESRVRFVRLIDYLREDSQFDLTKGDGEQLAQVIIDWMHARGRTEDLPRPPLKSDDELEADITIPLHLDELLMLPRIDEDLFYDKVLDGRLIPGLESVLTVHTSLAFDRGDPEKLARQGRTPEGPEGEPGGRGTEGAKGQPSAANQPQSDAPGAPAEQPVGLGIRININTATRPVLRCLFAEHEVPRAVIEAILRYRNEEVEEEEGEEESGTDSISEYYGEFETGQQVKKKIFKSVQDLESVPEFQNLANPDVKQKLFELTTVKSDVFSIHMASLFKRNEERRTYVLRRSRSIMVRFEAGEEAALYPLALMENRAGLRIMPVDFAEDVADYRYRVYELDQFSREERVWNPFYLDFYRPQWQREMIGR